MPDYIVTTWENVEGKYLVRDVDSHEEAEALVKDCQREWPDNVEQMSYLSFDSTIRDSERA